eukprot:4399217-Alexandrium_andersonii.AAC.1
MCSATSAWEDIGSRTRGSDTRSSCSRGVGTAMRAFVNGVGLRLRPGQLRPIWPCNCGARAGSS